MGVWLYLLEIKQSSVGCICSTLGSRVEHIFAQRTGFCNEYGLVE
jgi:hypothetical protein